MILVLYIYRERGIDYLLFRNLFRLINIKSRLNIIV